MYSWNAIYYNSTRISLFRGDISETEAVYGYYISICICIVLYLKIYIQRKCIKLVIKEGLGSHICDNTHMVQTKPISLCTVSGLNIFSSLCCSFHSVKVRSAVYVLWICLFGGYCCLSQLHVNFFFFQTIDF